MQWLINRAKESPQTELKEALNIDLPKCEQMYADATAVKKLFKFYNDYLNPSTLPESSHCPECVVKIVRYFSYIKSNYKI